MLKLLVIAALIVGSFWAGTWWEGRRREAFCYCLQDYPGGPVQDPAAPR